MFSRRTQSRESRPDLLDVPRPAREHHQNRFSKSISTSRRIPSPHREDKRNHHGPVRSRRRKSGVENTCVPWNPTRCRGARLPARAGCRSGSPRKRIRHRSLVAGALEAPSHLLSSEYLVQVLRWRALRTGRPLIVFSWQRIPPRQYVQCIFCFHSELKLGNASAAAQVSYFAAEETLVYVVSFSPSDKELKWRL
jgi:hypothetical protein